MKTYIIQLEPHDDLISVKDKLSWSKAQRVVLAWPRRGKVLSQFFDLSLLKRESERLGIRLAFVTHDAAVKENAAELGVPVYSSVSAAQRQAWSGQMRKKIPRKLPVGYERLSVMRQEYHQKPRANLISNISRIFFFILGILAVTFLVGVFLPSAVVKIYPERTKQELKFQVGANEQQKTFSVTGEIPAKVKHVELTLEQTGVSTGLMDASVETARGTVHFASTSSLPITLFEGTLLQSEDDQKLLFILDSEVIIDPAIGGADGMVRAQKAGAEGNLPAGTVLTVLTDSGDRIQAMVKETFTGGKAISSPTPTDDDYYDLEKQMLNQLRSQAVMEIKNSLDADEILIPETLSDGQVVSRIRSVEPGNPADHFNLTLTVDFSAKTYRAADLYALSETLLDANLPNGMTPVKGSLEVDPAANVELDAKGRPSWQVHVNRWIMPTVDHEMLTSRMAGINLGSVAETLSAIIPLRKASEVQISPSWWKWMPYISFRINLEVD